jgi:hypothetical protein
VSSRAYPIVVALWVAAAVLAVAWSLRVVTPAPAEQEVGALEALPGLSPGERAPASFETEDTLPSALKGVVVEPVQGGWTGPGGRDFHVVVRSQREADYSHRQIGRRSFYLGLRLTSSEVTHDPCASCHEGQGLVDGRETGEEQSVHQNIRPVHPEETGAQCLTCHAAADVGSLALERGGTVSIDHAYRLCAQCHFRQVESWAYGAHGKRLVGWRGRRVVMSCADCHDPHRPAVQQRLPMAGLGLPGPLRTEGEGQEEGASHD